MINTLPRQRVGDNNIPAPVINVQPSRTVIINGIERWWVAIRARLTILFLAITTYRSISQALKVITSLKAFREATYGRTKRRRCSKVDGKYYFALYLPGFPSKLFNRAILTEFNRIAPHRRPSNRIQTIHFAITNKCPLRCEHCFEWNNLNKTEPFTPDELKSLINIFQKAGCSQFHFTGGEPMMKTKLLEALIRLASPESECWVLTSGYNLTGENAERLKRAGAKGVIISLDHFDPAIHNLIRGSEQAFNWVMSAVKNANKAKLVTGFSICLSRAFISENNLLNYAELAKRCGVSFVQLLEPKPVGHFEKSDVLLPKEQLDFLDSFFLEANFDKQYKDYPVFIYHGFYQRRSGCLAAGKWSLYIDSAGFIDACPFCHTKTYNARDIISCRYNLEDIQFGVCPMYSNSAPA